MLCRGDKMWSQCETWKRQHEDSTALRMLAGGTMILSQHDNHVSFVKVHPSPSISMSEESSTFRIQWRLNSSQLNSSQLNWTQLNSTHSSQLNSIQANSEVDHICLYATTSWTRLVINYYHGSHFHLWSYIQKSMSIVVWRRFSFIHERWIWDDTECVVLSTISNDMRHLSSFCRITRYYEVGIYSIYCSFKIHSYLWAENIIIDGRMNRSPVVFERYYVEG